MQHDTFRAIVCVERTQRVVVLCTISQAFSIGENWGTLRFPSTHHKPPILLQENHTSKNHPFGLPLQRGITESILQAPSLQG